MKEEEYSLCFKGYKAGIVLFILIAVFVCLFLYLLRKFIEGPYYTKKNRIDGKVVIITGSNSGLGKETAFELAKRGARIYMACRDYEKCEKVRLEIMQQTQNKEIYNRVLDLGSMASIKEFVEGFLAEEQKLDILINNAGIMASPKVLTKDGFEQQFGVNHLGHFYLTYLLLNILKKSAPSRVIVLTSIASFFGRINKDDLMGDKKYRRFWGAYCQSKLANVLFTRQLAKKLKDTGVTVNCCHPGIVRTDLWRYMFPKSIRFIMNALTRYFYKSPKAGIQSTLRLALDPVLEKSTGGFYADTLKMPMLPWLRNDKNAEWLWRKSEQLLGLQPVEHEVESIVVNHM